MIFRCPRVWYRHRGYLRVLFVAAALTCYCLVLGNYAVANYDSVNTHGNRSRQYPAAAKRQTSPPRPAPTAVLPRLEVTAAPVDYSSLEAELEERRLQAAHTCDEYSLADAGEPNAWEFFIDFEHSLVWCNVFKAASSTWMYYFNLLGGYKDQYLRRSNKTPLILARTRFPRPTVDQLRAALPRSLSFLVVREPFERLLSAFRNKIENSRHRFYRKIAGEMVAKYRTGKREERPGRGPTFPEFVSYVVERARGSGKRARYDEHWAPYHEFCTPCHVNFSVIAKMETFERDQEYIIRRAGVESILVKELRRKNPKSITNKARDGLNTATLLEKYYSKLTPAQVRDLYDIYKMDFEMFGYDARKYFRMAEQSESRNISTSTSRDAKHAIL